MNDEGVGDGLNQGLPLPDLGIAAHYLQGLGIQMARCANIRGQDDAKLLRNLVTDVKVWMENIQASVLQLQASVVELRASVDELRARKLASRYNAAARDHNSFVVHPWHSPNLSLAPFHNVATNEIISGFPSTVREFLDIVSEALDHVLVALGLEVDGDYRTKRRRLAQTIGVNSLIEL